MAGSVNKVILIGNVGNNPEIKTFSDGNKYANLSIATSDTWKDKNTGEKKERTEWHRVSITNSGLVSICEKYIKKGTKLYIEGELQTRKWTDPASGQDKYSTEIVLKPYRGQLTILSSNQSDNSGGFSEPSPYSQQSDNDGKAFGETTVNDMEDTIPF